MMRSERDDYLQCLIVFFFFFLKNNFAKTWSLPKTGIGLNCEAELDTKWKGAEVKLEWVRMHFEISGFSHGLPVWYCAGRLN